MAQDKETSLQIRKFAKSLEKEIAKYKEFNAAKAKDHLAAQKAQMELLMALEAEFKDCIRKHTKGSWAYEKFIDHITNERGNILHARPFFRERQTLFTAEISPALKQKDAKRLMKFRINYRFISYVYSLRKWTIKIRDLFERIQLIRTEVCTTNMPLAINRAKIFWSKTPQSHLSYLDLVQIASEGLLSAIDKFVPPFGKSFRDVIIGRIVGNEIEAYNQTLIHFWPPDKKKIYRGNKANRMAGSNYEIMTEAVNDGVKKHEMTNPDELAQLMAAASHVSTELVVNDPSAPKNQTRLTTLGETIAADTSVQPDFQAEGFEMVKKLYEAIETLSIVKQKILKMKGINI